MCLLPSDSVGSTARHVLRDLVLCLARASGFAAAAEKPGMLPPRPLIGAAREDGVHDADARSQARRPADVYLPS